MAETFTSFQRSMWQFLAKCGMCRYHVDVTRSGRYKIRKSRYGNVLFWCLWSNTFLKFCYHVLTYHGLLGVQVHFLDQMSILDWLLMYWHVFMECLVWYFKYPLWENLYRQWELQEDIYEKLGRPKLVAKRITRTDKINFVVYGGICVVGTLALAIQFFQTPKYALNTYAIIPGDTLPLRIIFCLHECLFICHGYAYQGFTMVLAESYACSYQHLLEEMNKVLKEISNQTKENVEKSVRVCSANSDAKPIQKFRDVSFRLKRKQIFQELQIFGKGTKYNVMALLQDYKKIMISAQFHNQWIGKMMGLPEGVNYCQFVSDVFMMIQLLKESDTDYLGVFFYMMDAVFGMVMIFRMLITLSRLYPQAEEFINRLKVYASLDTGLRKELRKSVAALQKVSAKLGGYVMKPQSVPVGINILINWYIVAALWKRPDDPSRRT